MFTWRSVPFEKRTLRSGSKDFVPFRKIELDFGASMSRDTQPTCLEFYTKATEPLPRLFFWSVVRLIVNLSEHESAHFTESASLFSCVLLTCGMMSGITRRIRTVPTNVVLARSSKSLPRRTPTSERLFFRRFFPSLFVYGSGAGRDELVDFPHLFSSWRKLQASSFVHFPFVFSIDSILLASFPR